MEKQLEDFTKNKAILQIKERHNLNLSDISKIAETLADIVSEYGGDDYIIGEIAEQLRGIA